MLLGTAIVLLVSIIVWYLSAYQAGSTSISSVMGQMMGSQYSGAAISPMPSYVWLTIVLVVILVALGVIGLTYYAIYPQIPVRHAPIAVVPVSTPKLTEAEEGPRQNVSWSTVLRTSKPDEKKVLEVLSLHGGKQLQKLIVKESGLSKLRTHRVVARFAQRGIVSVAKSGNTNEVRLSPWLNQGSDSEKNVRLKEE